MLLEKLFEKVLEESQDPMRYGSTLGSHEDDDDYKDKNFDNSESEFIIFDPNYNDDNYRSALD